MMKTMAICLLMVIGWASACRTPYHSMPGGYALTTLKMDDDPAFPFYFTRLPEHAYKELAYLSVIKLSGDSLEKTARLLKTEAQKMGGEGLIGVRLQANPADWNMIILSGTVIQFTPHK